jgi:hypothetical protein
MVATENARGKLFLTSMATVPRPALAPHLQNIDGINFLFIKKGGLYFVCTTKFNVSPSFTLELLDRLAKVFKDYCGVLGEEAIRKNFVLVYELLDEMIVREARARRRYRRREAGCRAGGRALRGLEDWIVR